MAKAKLSDVLRDGEMLLRRDGVRATDLVASIHAVNPTTRNLGPEEQRRAYALKSKLQSRLILEFFEELRFDDVEGMPVFGPLCLDRERLGQVELLARRLLQGD